MAAILEAESTLTDRYQTTVPEPVRKALRLGRRDRLRYEIRPGGEVVLTRGPCRTACRCECQCLRLLRMLLNRRDWSHRRSWSQIRCCVFTIIAGATW